MTEPNRRALTRRLYLEDAYMKEFKAKVQSVQKTNGRLKVILDQSAFYPVGGGQPSDAGAIKGTHVEAAVREARVENGMVVHTIDLVKGDLREGDEITGIVDWDRRYALMQNHTLAHLMAEVIRKVVGFPIEVVSSGLDVDKARLDMAYEVSLGPFVPEIEKVADQIIREDKSVEVRMMPRGEAEAYVARFHESLKTLPPGVKTVRVIEIKDWHACACGGTHVRSTSEIVAAEVLRRMSKGKSVERVEFRAKTS
jgi:Ser-tRNA(Ala) deacylase AlaX